MGCEVRDNLVFRYLSSRSGENHEYFAKSVTSRVKSQTIMFLLKSFTSERNSYIINVFGFFIKICLNDFNSYAGYIARD
jgi:hypothetical protein